MNGKIRLWLLGVAGCLIAAAAWSILSTPGGALAKGKPPGAGGSNGQFNTQGYWVWFSQDPLGAFEPEGPPPEGSVENGTDGGSINVIAGSVADPDDPRMLVHSNQSCLVSIPGGAETDPLALWNDDDFASPDIDEDFAGCFPAPSQGTMSISADGTTVQMHIHGLSKSGRDMGYRLTIKVIRTDVGGAWDPLGIAPGNSATLYLGEWVLTPTTQNPKQQAKGCFAMGDFSDDEDPITGAVGTAVTVSRWTLDEQAAQDACE